VKLKNYFLTVGGLCLAAINGAAEAAPKPPKACDIKKARPANRFGSYLVPKPDVEAQPQSSEDPALLLVPDDAISPPSGGKKQRKRKQSSILNLYESC
jgi:hypothetical protein